MTQTSTAASPSKASYSCHLWVLLSIIVLTASCTTAALLGQTPSVGAPENTSSVDYPLAAKAAGIEGTVVVKGIIDTDGKMRNLRAVKGPVELRQAAINITSRYPYKPIVNDHGTPVAIETKVKIVFSMGNKKQKAVAQEIAQEELDKETSKDSVKK